MFILGALYYHASAAGENFRGFDPQSTLRRTENYSRISGKYQVGISGEIKNFTLAALGLDNTWKKNFMFAKKLHVHGISIFALKVKFFKKLHLEGEKKNTAHNDYKHQSRNGYLVPLLALVPSSMVSCIPMPPHNLFPYSLPFSFTIASSSIL